MFIQCFLLLYAIISFGLMMRAIDAKNYNAIVAWLSGYVLLWLACTHGAAGA